MCQPRNMLLSNETSCSDDETIPEVSQRTHVHPESTSDGIVSGTELQHISSLETSRSRAGFATPAIAITDNVNHQSTSITSNGQHQILSCRQSNFTAHENRYFNNSSPADNEPNLSTSPVTVQSATPATDVTMMTSSWRYGTLTQQSDGNITNHLSSVSNAYPVNIPSVLPETLPAFNNIINDGRAVAQDIESNRPITSYLDIPQHNRHTATNIRAHPYARSESRHTGTSSDVSVLPLRPAVSSFLTSNTDATSSRPCPLPAEELIQNPRAFGIFVEKPKHPELALYETRLSTYSKWPKDHHFKPEVLARAGLYYVGRVDCARCFFCGGGMRNWRPEDDPCVEHARWFPKCAFICQYMGQEFVDAVKILRDTSAGKHMTLTQVIEYMNSHGISQRHMYGNTFGRDDEVIQSVVERGFSIDRVRCAAAKLRESGSIVSASSVYEELKKTDREHQTDENNCAASIGGQCSETLGNEAEIQKLRHQNDVLRSQVTCKICLDREVQMAFLPCGHVVSCQECSARLTTCATCRANINGVLRVYLV